MAAKEKEHSLLGKTPGKTHRSRASVACHNCRQRKVKVSSRRPLLTSLTLTDLCSYSVTHNLSNLINHVLHVVGQDVSVSSTRMQIEGGPLDPLLPYPFRADPVSLDLFQGSM